MLTQLIDFTQNLFQAGGAWGVFAASVVEEVIAPIPSALVMTGAGFSLLGDMVMGLPAFVALFLRVALPAALGVTLGSFLVYGLAYWLGKPFIEKWGGYFGVSWGAIEKAQIKFENGYADEIMVFGLRVVPIIPSVAINAFCGLMRVPVRSYVLYTFLGTVVRAMVLGFVGWQAQALYVVWAEKIDHAEKYIEIGIVIAVIAYAVVGFTRYWKKRSLR